MAITIPGTSEPIGSVDYATNAGHATTADTATSATTAGHATTAGSASTATNAGHATTADTATSAASATNAASATYAGRLRIYENFYVKEFTISNVNNQGSLDITLPGMVPIGIVGWHVNNQQLVLEGRIREGSYHSDGYWDAGPEAGYSGVHHYLDYCGYNPSMQSVSASGTFRIMYFRDYSHQ